MVSCTSITGSSFVFQEIYNNYFIQYGLEKKKSVPAFNSIFFLYECAQATCKNACGIWYMVYMQACMRYIERLNQRCIAIESKTYHTCATANKTAEY